jgi:hypothetical protein
LRSAGGRLDRRAEEFRTKNAPRADGNVLAALFRMSLVVRSEWVTHLLADADHLEYGGLLEVVSFVTLVVMIAVAGISVAALTLWYAL